MISSWLIIEGLNKNAFIQISYFSTNINFNNNNYYLYYKIMKLILAILLVLVISASVEARRMKRVRTQHKTQLKSKIPRKSKT